MSFDEKDADAASAAALAADDATRARAAARRASNPRVPAPPLPLVDDPVGSVSEAQIWGWRIALYGTMAGMLIGVAAVARKAL